MCDNFIPYIPDTSPHETDALLRALEGEPPVSVRLNPFKTTALPEVDILDMRTQAAPATGRAIISGRVPWSAAGHYLSERPSFTFDPLFHAGHYYVQEASSMFVEHIFRSITGMGADFAAGGGRDIEATRRETAKPLRLLDMCAAPGGKTTLYSSLAGHGGMVVANEVIHSRAGLLADNVRKWGLGNVVVTNNDPSYFATLGEWFDIVAVDAPCSGEGMFRKNPEAREQWSEENVKMCALRQRRILADAWKALRPGGVLIYSTCTFNRSENEDNVEWLTQNFDCEDAAIPVPEEWNIVQTESGGVECFRFYPHRTAGEGFFAAAIRKGGENERRRTTQKAGSAPKARKNIFSDAGKGEAAELARWVERPERLHFAKIGDNFYCYRKEVFQDIKTVSESLNAIYSGVCMGQIFGGRLKPEHSLAMYVDLIYGRTEPSASLSAELSAPSKAGLPVPCGELSMEEAIRFLQREELHDISELEEGMNLVTFSGAPLGWAKRVGGRINNLYPKQLAIQSRKYHNSEGF